MSNVLRDARRKVTSVGNSWIVCKSKSHPGHVYYFNSLTGEAAWNLSDAEIEKAKQTTKRLEHLPGSKPTKCPEPKDKPPSPPSKDSQQAHSQFNEEFVINRISEQQSSVLNYSNIANSNGTFCTPFNQMSGIMQGTQINNPSQIEPVCNLNSLSTYNLNGSPIIYNPRVWAVPHPQQVYIAPAIAPIVNTSPGSPNDAFNQFSQAVLQPATGLVSNRYDNASQSEIIMRGTRSFNPRALKGTINKKIGFTKNKNDLRQKLSYKKKFNKISSLLEGSGPRKLDISTHIATKEGIHANDLRNGMESRCVETQLHETPSKIDLGPLTRLASSDSNSEAWFIVVDLEVLLNEFKFLTTLTDSDEKCHLMVPKRVMDELKAYVTCTENIQARRILRFLSQQIEIGYAYMAEEPSTLSTSEKGSMADAIHATCTELSNNKYHLILLTNDSELLTKDSSNINMFCIDEIKNLLKNNPDKQQVSSGPKKPFMSNELIHQIQIIVPNNTTQNKDTTSPVRDIHSVDHTENIPKSQPGVDHTENILKSQPGVDHTENIPKSQPEQNKTQNKTEELKKLVDAGIQTDLEGINFSISILSVVEKDGLNADSNSPRQTTKEVITSRSVSSVSNIPDRKREIKLKRSTSYQPAVHSAENEKKQFKWRRRRNTTLQVNENVSSLNDQNMNTKNMNSLQTNTLSNEISKMSDRTSNNIPTCDRIENKISEDSIESRESSIYVDARNSTKENVTIEETSTSGIISNTESNVDAESNYSNSTNSLNQQFVYNEKSHNKPMYEVDSVTMEQYLRMKCDEWISRFIQIMEEVLSQVLQQEPSFTHSAMPPPWTLHEAAQCIAIKFCGHQDIIAAANKLSNTLFHVSDAKGIITMDMTPCQYMEMYSYGVHLLAAIMEVTTSCEDIQIAVESLNKLLHDIRNPNMDSSTNDTFNDNTKHNNLSNNDVSVDSNNSDGSSLHEQQMLPEYNQTEEVRTLEPEKIISKEQLQKPVKFIRNFDIPYPFFKNLDNKKSNIVKKVKSQVQLCEEHSTHSQTGEGNKAVNANKTAEKGTESDIPTHQPNIIRKFSRFPKFEEKLKINNKLKVYEQHHDDLDYSEDYGEYLTEDDNYNEQRNDVNSNQTDVRSDTNDNNYESKSPKVIDSFLCNENNKKFKYMMFTLLQEIKDALCQVRILCDQCYEALQNPEQSTELKYQLRKKAERAHLHIIRLYRSLESMLDYDTNNPTQSLANLLKQANIDIDHVDAGLLFEYRATVTKCKEHAQVFLNSIQNIISDIKR